MNDNKAIDFAVAHEALGVIEILDADGNPTGEYINAGIGEGTEETAYVADSHPDHSVTVH